MVEEPTDFLHSDRDIMFSVVEIHVTTAWNDDLCGSGVMSVCHLLSADAPAIKIESWVRYTSENFHASKRVIKGTD